MSASDQVVEPWLRGTHTELDAVRRQVIHALELAGEDLERWCAELSSMEAESHPHGLPSVGFQLRHIARSLDRLLTYAEGRQLTATQNEALGTELNSNATVEVTLAELRDALGAAVQRILAIAPDTLEHPRGVGRKMLPTTVGGLLIHCAEHTQRHVGQTITTAKVLLAMRESEGSR